MRTYFFSFDRSPHDAELVVVPEQAAFANFSDVPRLTGFPGLQIARNTISDIGAQRERHDAAGVDGRRRSWHKTSAQLRRRHAQLQSRWPAHEAAQRRRRTWHLGRQQAQRRRQFVA